MKHKILLSFFFVLISLLPAWSQLTTMHASLSGIGIKSLNGLTAKTQTFATGTTGTDFNISSSGSVHTFNIPTASATNRGLLSSADWTAFNSHFTLPAFTSGSVIFSNGTTLAQDNPNFFWDDTNNRLGLGTTTPTTEFQVVSTSGSDPRGIMSSQYSSDTLAARFHFRKSRGTMSSPTTIVTGDLLGRTRFSGYDGTSFLQMASIDAGTYGTVGTNRIPTFLAFSTAKDSAVSVLREKMRLSGEGQLLLSSPSLVSTSILKLNGSWFSNTGSTTTTKPHFLIEPTGTSSNNWSLSGTGLGINAASGFNGNMIEIQRDAVSAFKVSALATTIGNNYLTGVGASRFTINSSLGMALTIPSGNGLSIGTTGADVGSVAKVQITADDITAPSSFGVLNMLQTWNNASSNPTAIKLNITNTSSAASALLMDLQVGGTSLFKVAKDGGLTNAVGIATPTIATSSYFGWTGQRILFTNGVVTNYSIIKSQVNGNIVLSNSAENTFDYLQFGGTTSSFPALKRVTTGLEVKLADNSAYTTISASKAILTNTISLISTGGAATAGTVTLVGGTATVNTTAMTSTALLFITRKTAGGTLGMTTYTQVNGTSFTINSDNALDTSTFVWHIVETY